MMTLRIQLRVYAGTGISTMDKKHRLTLQGRNASLGLQAVFHGEDSTSMVFRTECSELRPKVFANQYSSLIPKCQFYSFIVCNLKGDYFYGRIQTVQEYEHGGSDEGSGNKMASSSSGRY